MPLWGTPSTMAFPTLIDSKFLFFLKMQREKMLVFWKQLFQPDSILCSNGCHSKTFLMKQAVSS
jgi:hypothetical protein